MRLIDADELKSELDAWARIIQKPKHYMREDALYVVDTAPTIEAVPVVRGEWVIIDDGVLIGNGKHVECSNCGAWSGQSEKPPYCKHCGAAMTEDNP